MLEWARTIQMIIDDIDASIRLKETDEISLKRLSDKMGYSEFHMSRMFHKLSGMPFRDYVRMRKLAFALDEVKNTRRAFLDIAVDYGFQSQEAFIRAFREAYHTTPGEYRKNPQPVVLRTILRPFDCYIMETGGTGMKKTNSDVKTYFVTIPAHKFLHVKNLESIGYWDFWQKQSKIPGQDCETITGLLSSLGGNLDNMGDNDLSSGSGQLMAFINEPTGRICSWGIPLAECYGVRLPVDWEGEKPDQMILTNIPEGEYIVFEHGPFDYETQNQAVEAKIEKAMKDFDYASSGYKLDTSPGRIFYFYHDCKRYWKYVRPVVKA
ncbi:MAG: helix-turn-helix transcriptional regulator [Clostridiales bacterium]|nr:helix-turn-helix transcriptional regulator [Clostridiales bacterium]